MCRGVAGVAPSSSAAQGSSWVSWALEALAGVDGQLAVPLNGRSLGVQSLFPLSLYLGR